VDRLSLQAATDGVVRGAKATTAPMRNPLAFRASLGLLLTALTVRRAPIITGAADWPALPWMPVLGLWGMRSAPKRNRSGGGKGMERP